jgi:hypothetical protein
MVVDAAARDAMAWLLRREGLGNRATHPFTKDQIALVALAARDARAWLEEPGAVADPERLPSVEESLLAQTKKLDDLERLLTNAAQTQARVTRCMIRLSCEARTEKAG